MERPDGLAVAHADEDGVGGDVEAVPTQCITQGLATIMEARKLVLIATGEGKAAALASASEAFAGPEVPLPGDGAPLEVPAAWAVGRHGTRWFLDRAAASRLEG